MPARLTREEFIARSQKRHGTNFDFSETNFLVGGHVLNTFICSLHSKKITHLSGRDFLRIDVPCSECRDEKKRLKCNAAHGDRFDYSQTNFEFPEADENNVICRKHGLFAVTLTDHIRFKSGGCSGCDSDWISERQRMPLSEFIERANLVHGEGHYDYSMCVQRDNLHELQDIKCPRHNLIFRMSGANHLFGKKRYGNRVTSGISDGQGCRLCSTQSHVDRIAMTLDEWVSRCEEIHDGRYDYSEVIWKGRLGLVEIICSNPKHDNFWQRASDHLAGRGCSKCASRVSGKERAWLKQLEVPEKYWQTKIQLEDKVYTADAYNPFTNTVYEFWGDYWHGNPKTYPERDAKLHTGKTFKAVYESTQIKRQALLEAGYKLVEIWESDFANGNFGAGFGLD